MPTGWEKVGKDEWKNGNKRIELIFDEDVWGVFLNDEILTQDTDKSKAMKFAIKYMREHPRG